jgi:hypothetical protein
VTSVERALADAGAEVGYEMFYDQPADTPYELSDGEIMVRDREGKVTAFATISPLVQALNRQLMFRRIHVAPQWRDIAVGAVRS